MEIGTGTPFESGHSMKEGAPAHSVRNRLSEFFHRTFTLEGRQEAQMKKRQYDQILEKLPEDERKVVEPVLEERARKAAVGSIVRDAAVGVLTAAGIGTAIWKRKEIGGLMKKGASIAKENMPAQIKDIGTKAAAKAGEVKTNAGDAFHGLQKKVTEGIAKITKHFKKSTNQ